MQHIMSDKDLHIKQEDFDVISIHEDDASFQYTIVPNSLIRDQSISPNCRWLIIYLISNKPGWTIKSRQLWEHTKGFIGRDAIRKTLNEAIEAGYIQRNMVLRETAKGKLRGYSYTVASTPKFKKCLRKPGFQGPGFQGPDDQGTKEVLSYELLSLRNNSLKVQAEQQKEAPLPAAKAAEVEKLDSPQEKPKRTRNPAEFNTATRELGEKMINILVRNKPNYVPPRNLAPFLTHVDYLLRLDKRDAQLVEDVFSWAVADSFWADKMYKPNPAEYLRKQFDQLEMKMNAKPEKKDRKFAPSSNDARSLEKMQEWEKGAL